MTSCDDDHENDNEKLGNGEKEQEKEEEEINHEKENEDEISDRPYGVIVQVWNSKLIYWSHTREMVDHR